MLQETSSVGLFFLPADDKFFMQVFLFFPNLFSHFEAPLALRGLYKSEYTSW